MIKDIYNVTFIESIIVTIFSISVVFLCLIIISCMIYVIRLLLYKKEPKKEVVKETINKENKIVESDDSELVAIITSAIAHHSNICVQNLYVRNIVRQIDIDNPWSIASKNELMNNMKG